MQDPIPVPFDDLTRTVDNTDTLANRIICGSGILKACKYHDYFTSCLPSPQKGPDVSIPLSGLAHVVTGTSIVPTTSQPISFSHASDKENVGYLSGRTGGTASIQSGIDANSLIPNNLYASLGSTFLFVFTLFSSTVDGQ